MQTLKYVIAWPIAWTLYGIGHAIARTIMNHGWVGAQFYPIYNRLMISSCSWSDWGGMGIWGDLEMVDDRHKC